MRLEHTVRVNAPVADAFAVMADVHRWPDFMSALESVRATTLDDGTLLADLSESTGRHRDCARYRIRFVAPSGMRAIQVTGALWRCEVTWRLLDGGGTTDVVVAHRFAVGWPLAGPILDRVWIGPRIIHPVVARSLANFKALVETGRSPKQNPARQRCESKWIAPAPKEGS